MTGGNRNSHFSIEVCIGAATVVVSTAAYLLGSPKLAVISLVIGGVSFGLLFGVRG